MFRKILEALSLNKAAARSSADSEVSGTTIKRIRRDINRDESFDEFIPATLIRMVKILDQIDGRVEQLRKEALELQTQADILNFSIEALKHDNFHGLDEGEREEIECYIQRISSRLATIELSVRTIRTEEQTESLHKINSLIDELLIANCDPVATRQRCQQFLNACNDGHNNEEPQNSDKKFEVALLGCTLDDQKNIKRRLSSLLEYLLKQTVSRH